MKKLFLPAGYSAAALLILYSLITATYIPYNIGTYLPGLAGVVLGFICIFRKRIAALLNTSSGKKLTPFILAAIGFFFISFSAMVGAIVINANQLPKNGADAIVVLGAGLRGDQVSLTLALRLNAAAKYLNDNPETVVVVSGGMGVGETVSEASAMKSYLLRKGIDEGRILCEDNSTSTFENFKFSKLVLDEYLGHEEYNIVFVTNDFHCIRAGIYAKRTGFSAESLACPTPLFTIPADYSREYLALVQAMIPFL